MYIYQHGLTIQRMLIIVILNFIIPRSILYLIVL